MLNININVNHHQPVEAVAASFNNRLIFHTVIECIKQICTFSCFVHMYYYERIPKLIMCGLN